MKSPIPTTFSFIYPLQSCLPLTPWSIIITPPLWISTIICLLHHYHLSILPSWLNTSICLLCAGAQSAECCGDKSCNVVDWLLYILHNTNLNRALDNECQTILPKLPCKPLGSSLLLFLSYSSNLLHSLLTTQLSAVALSKYFILEKRSIQAASSVHQIYHAI